MSYFSCEGLNATVAATEHLVSVYNDTTGEVRAWIYDVILGSGASADNAARWLIQRSSTAPSGGSASTPAPLDAADSAAEMLGYQAATGGLTAGTVLCSFGANQRMTARWVAQPGSELVIPATASHGITLYCEAISASFSAQGTMFFYE